MRYLSWQAGEVRCGGALVTPLHIERPAPQQIYGAFEVPNVSYAFRIDETGRPHGIKRIVEKASYSPFTQDISAALAVSLFPVGKAQEGCTISYDKSRATVEDANIDDLITLTLLPNPPRNRAIWERMYPEGSDCGGKPLHVVTRSFPDFELLPDNGGRFDWSMVRFDVDADGAPVNVGIYRTTGNDVLDVASVDAVKRTRFSKTTGARKGCLYPYWLRKGRILPPESPSEESFPNGAACPKPPKWEKMPPLSYPDPFQRRWIEGWAIIGYDVAPWGQTGNVKVLAAEPAEDFGNAAQALVRTATAKTSGQGYSGCTEMVRYRMDPNKEPSVTAPGVPPHQ